MKKAGHTPYDIERMTGLPAATTYRFLNGDIKQPREDSIKAWTKVYGLTESQLRGDAPIEGMEAPAEKPELKDLLTLDEYKHMSNIKSMNKEARSILYRLAEMLVEPQAANHKTFIEERNGGSSQDQKK